VASFKYKVTLRSLCISFAIFYVITPFHLLKSRFTAWQTQFAISFAEKRASEGPVRPHNPRLSRDLQMHNACMVQGKEWREKRVRRRKKRDMQAKVIRSSLQGTRRSQGEGWWRGRENEQRVF